MKTERQYKGSARMCLHAATGIISLPLLTATLSSCGTANSTTDMRRDSTYITARLTDKEKEVKRHTDSVYVRDSIYVCQKGDTVTKYVERTRHKTTTRHDTVRIERLRADTVYAVRESIISEKEEKPLRWHDKVFMKIGQASTLATAVLIIVALVRKKVS